MDDRIIGRIPRSVEMRIPPAIVSAMVHVFVLGAPRSSISTSSASRR